MVRYLSTQYSNNKPANQGGGKKGDTKKNDIIQSQTFKRVSIVLNRVLKNRTKWFDSNPHMTLTKYVTDH